jgi:flagellar hook-basal body complex protein FliE
MKIEGFGNLLPSTVQPGKVKQTGTENFNNTFSDLIKDVNQDQINSQNTIEKFVSGDGIQLHEVMIAGEKAKTSLELLMEIRNKTVDMFKELTRMPI